MRQLIYVSAEDSGQVAIVDPVRALVEATISVGKRPRGLKLSPDGKVLYVALSGSQHAAPGVDESELPPPDGAADGIGVIDVAARKLVRTFQAGRGPASLDLSPDGKALYVSNEATAEMTTLELPSGVIRGKVSVGKEPEGVTVRPDGKAVYVTSEQDGEVTAIETATLAVVAHMRTGRRPRSIVFTRDGLTAFVPNEVDRTVTVLDIANHEAAGTIQVQAGTSTPSGPRPMGAVLSPDGKLLYVSCGRGALVVMIDVATRKQVRLIDGVGDRPWGIGLSPDGTRLYTANGPSEDISITNLLTGNVDNRVHIGGSPWGLVVAPP